MQFVIAICADLRYFFSKSTCANEALDRNHMGCRKQSRNVNTLQDPTLTRLFYHFHFSGLNYLHLH